MDDLSVNKIIADFASQMTGSVAAKCKEYGMSFSDKFKVTLGSCFSNYLKRYYEKYSKTKTLLYRDRPVSIRSFYVRANFSVSDDEFAEENIFSFLEKEKKVVFYGTAGCGKSTFCKSLFLDFIERKKDYFPVFVELRHLNEVDEVTLLGFIEEMLQDVEAGFRIEQLEYALKCGKIVLILDGFDELDKSIKEAIEKEIIAISNRYKDVLVIVSSRPDSKFDAWDEYVLAKVLPLDKEKAKLLVSKLEYDAEVKDKFYKGLEVGLYEKHESFASNPLLLTMMLLTYEQVAEIPEKMHLFYEQAFLTLFNKHDSLKSLYKRKSNTGLSLDSFKKVLSAFSTLTYLDQKYFFEYSGCIDYLEKARKISNQEFDPALYLDDLQDAVCILQKDGLGYTFTHRSFQEYFTAIFIVNFSSDHVYALVDKASETNSYDNVITMIYDMNPDFLERNWIMPKLDVILDKYKGYTYSQYDKFLICNTFTNTVVLDQDHGIIGLLTDEAPVSFLLALFSIYDDTHDSIKINKKEEVEALSKILDSEVEYSIKELYIKGSDEERKVLEKYCFDRYVGHLDYMKRKHKDLTLKHKEKNDTASMLLLNFE